MHLWLNCSPSGLRAPLLAPGIAPVDFIPIQLKGIFAPPLWFLVLALAFILIIQIAERHVSKMPIRADPQSRRFFTGFHHLAAAVADLPCIHRLILRTVRAA